MLYASSNLFFSKRILPEKFSNSDENEVAIHVENKHSFPLNIDIIDELPFQFQKRDFELKTKLNKGENKVLKYFLTPKKRGEYSFGNLNVYVSSPLGFIQRQYRFDAYAKVPVYPSFLQMRKFELLAIHQNLTNIGIKKIRRIGHTMEFEQIKNYTQGDDYRTVNWLASARKNELMVNQFQEEKSQQVYTIIDKGRLMKMPFEGLSLLDYSINSALVIANIAIRKSDKAGLITFSDKMSSFLQADRKPTQIHKLLETLYIQKSLYLESNFELLYATIRHKISQRSLLLLYTNFESIHSLHRNMTYLKSLAKYHVLVVIFFENTELKKLTIESSKNLEEVYIKAIAEKLAYEKRQMVMELQRFGVFSILTTPAELSVNVINKYLEIKARGIL